MSGATANPLRETTLPAALLAGDTVVAFAGLALGYWLRYNSALGALGLNVPDARFDNYLPLLLMGVVFLVAAFAQQGLYDGRMLLRKQHSLNLLARGTVFWVLVYLAFSLVIKFNPPISRLFVVIAGAVLYSNVEALEGRAYLYMGNAAGLGNSPAWTAESNQVGAQFGRSVASAGDVNGDG